MSEQDEDLAKIDGWCGNNIIRIYGYDGLIDKRKIPVQELVQNYFKHIDLIVEKIIPLIQRHHNYSEPTTLRPEIILAYFNQFLYDTIRMRIISDDQNNSFFMKHEALGVIFATEYSETKPYFLLDKHGVRIDKHQ